MNFKNRVKLFLPICVIIIVAISVLAILLTREDSRLVNETATVSNAETVSALGAENVLEGDKHPKINEVVVKYLEALAAGDVETISSITNNMSDIERIRVTELSKYIEAFPEYNVFTKIGPTEDSYIVYAAVRVKFDGLETLVPGIYCFYVCTDENGNYYFNEGVLTEEEQVYIDAINADATVETLMNSIETEYQALLYDNETVRNYVELMQSEIRSAVGETLVNAAATPDPNENSDPTILYTSCQAVTTDTINVRSSDSEAADKLGKLSKGTTIDVIEVRVNGWSKIQYQGKEAYVKTNYLEIIEPEDPAGTGDNVANGKVKANTTVNVRSQANTTSSRIGQVIEGETIDWIADVENGFSKVIYDGKVGYIKSEYLDKQ